MTNNLCGMPHVWAAFAGLDPATQLDEIKEMAAPMPGEAFKDGKRLVQDSILLYANSI